MGKRRRLSILPIRLKVRASRRTKHPTAKVVHTYPSWRQMNKWLLLITVVMIVSTVAFSAYTRITPIISSLAEAKASQIATVVMNEAINKHVMENDIDYDDLVVLQKNTDGRITAVSTNVAMTNRLKSQLALDVQERIVAIDRSDVEVPLGSILGSDLFEGMGPRISVKLIPSGFVVVDFVDSFTSVGINQTKHEVAIEITVKMSMLLPSGSKSVEVVTHVPVAQTVIVGEIPQAYFSR